MSKLISTTIKETNIPIFKELKEDLKRTNTSVGEFLIQSYIQLKKNNP